MRWLALAALAVLACRSHDEAPPPPSRPPPPPADASVWPHDALELPVGPAEDPIGTGDQIVSVEHDPRRRWVLVCQQRRGGLAWHLVLGSGPGRVLDGVEAVSRDGDHLVVGIDGAIALVDIAAHRATRLPGAGPLAAFSGDGKRVIVLEPGTPAHLARTDLATGATVRVELPPGDPGFMTADTSGTWAMVAMARHDADGNGTIRFGNYAWPREHACRTGDPSLADMANDPIEKVWIDLEHGTIQDAQDIVRVTGGHVLAQHDTALTLDGKPYGPRDCRDGLAVLGVVETPFDVLLYCRPKGARGTLTLVAHPRIRLPGEAFGFATTGRYADMLSDREQCLALDADDTCIELTTGKIHRQPRPPVAIGVHDGEEWLGGTPTHLLVGPPDHGPLHWRPRPASY